MAVTHTLLAVTVVMGVLVAIAVGAEVAQAATGGAVVRKAEVHPRPRSL